MVVGSEVRYKSRTNLPAKPMSDRFGDGLGLKIWGRIGLKRPIFISNLSANTPNISTDFRFFFTAQLSTSRIL